VRIPDSTENAMNLQRRRLSLHCKRSICAQRARILNNAKNRRAQRRIEAKIFALFDPLRCHSSRSADRLAAAEGRAKIFVPLRCYGCHFGFLLPHLISRESSVFLIAGQQS